MRASLNSITGPSGMHSTAIEAIRPVKGSFEPESTLPHSSFSFRGNLLPPPPCEFFFGLYFSRLKPFPEPLYRFTSRGSPCGILPRFRSRRFAPLKDLMPPKAAEPSKKNSFSRRWSKWFFLSRTIFLNQLRKK